MAKLRMIIELELIREYSRFFLSTNGPILSRQGTFLYKCFAFQHFIMAI